MGQERPRGTMGFSIQFGPFGGRQRSGGLSAALASGQLPFDGMFEHALRKALLSVENFIVKIPSLLGGVPQ